jgi:hypothetical protein
MEFTYFDSFGVTVNAKPGVLKVLIRRADTLSRPSPIGVVNPASFDRWLFHKGHGRKRRPIATVWQPAKLL